MHSLWLDISITIQQVEFKLTSDARKTLMTSRPLELHLYFHSFSILLSMYQLNFGNQ